MKSIPRTTAVCRASVACLAGLLGASAAHAVDWSGYMRGGPAATTVSGESRQCYGLNSPGLKDRKSTRLNSSHRP